MSEEVVITRGLTKRFGGLRRSSGGVLAVDGVDLRVGAGDRYGFLGPNGSGKTTTVRMLLGLVLPTSGSARVLGHDVTRDLGQLLPRVGALVEAPAAYGHLSARANLSLLDGAAPTPGGARARRSRVEAALADVGLAGVGRRPVRAFSLGMRQRLGLAAALVRRPELLILDEPTNGLDPQGIALVTDLLRRLNADGTTLFVSSHLLSEVESLCTRVGVMDRGHLVVQADVASLRRPTGRLLLRVDDPPGAVRILGGRVLGRRGDHLVVDVSNGGARASSSQLVGVESAVARGAGAGICNGPDADVEGGVGAGVDVVGDLVRGHVRVVEAVLERATLTDLVLARTTAVGEE